MTPQLKTVVSPEDLALYRKANEAMDRAATVQRFTHQHLEEIYQLGPGGTFDTMTGVITRTPAPEPPTGAPAQPTE